MFHGKTVNICSKDVNLLTVRKCAKGAGVTRADYLGMELSAFLGYYVWNVDVLSSGCSCSV